MKIKKRGIAGTLESSDLLVVINPHSSQEIKLVVQSKVEKQFGSSIRKTVKDTLAKCGVVSAAVDVRDQGALDCVIKARVEAAVYRASDEETVKFGDLS